jgi:hypothetical protein
MNKTLFPEGIYFDRKKHQYLTRKINCYLELVNSISRSYADKNIGPSKKIIGKPYPVASIELHSNKMWWDLRDFYKIVNTSEKLIKAKIR